ncbi:DUF3775 domain-containing protein [Litoreibacter roseus]|uniref:DUF3775 domain-containing protein n=1 Tax=Litoreibacter roseus TaxID=2601869 RepID=A0A6N6JJ75_9RHOB|nr:DUF3775 domain-containing protein [Litoreibacter roseus]GFE66326.1 hypothetical protein KIN_34000 [Litoreibacter roseus]
MLEISTDKVAQVILLAHEMERAENELRSFLDTLNEDEAASLVAVMWIGRESYGPDELKEALSMAYAEATTPTADYLIGTPHLADHLENGLEALGINATAAEDDLR